MAAASARSESRTGFERTVAFSDGVFAIAITLLVLSIDVPRLHGGQRLDHALSGLSDNFVSYFIGFAVIGLFWVGHHYFFDSLRGFRAPAVAQSSPSSACCPSPPRCSATSATIRRR